MPTSSSSQAAQRLEAVSAHLSSPTPPKMSTPEKKPPITCHVLDTSAGRPAASIPVTLTLHNPPSTLSPNPSALTFSGTTNADGRVTSWTSSSSFSADSLEAVFKRAGDQKYSLTFDTESYFGEKGVKTFFPEVEVKFVVRDEAKGEHYHVPVLLSPFGYTTYRGS
ncbi:Hydroxyisourate hydrolase [Bimuria novae-zelandiae CBS 107.79]|uniref:hydroxyisourate hydrolase n=1 Tax=Bimuria novae-zelandiae CBS 107.79 TaxID=1447943 RepID=A0A6A5VHU5_9PLEO|nr:Hydroxyisourate hydrolase [Bimuria novae-zelandiae CBS 107.79]